jgi:hypothetical protein
LRKGGEAGDVPADATVFAIRVHHHRQRVPADDRADLPLQRMVARRALLEVRRNGVEVGGGRVERQEGAGPARLLDQRLEQEVRALGSLALQHRFEGFEPLAGFLRVHVPQ